MQMLFESDDFIVLYLDANEAAEGEPERPKRDGFEIVSKKANTSLYLDGPWADAMSAQIKVWQANVPTQGEVEETLSGYALLAHNPLVYH